MIADPQFLRISVAESLRDACGARRPVKQPIAHLHGAMEWLKRAQDQTRNGGVAAGFGRLGWWNDYPETTGYIIPTFLDYYRFSSDSCYLESADRMGRYELAIQNSDGAIPGGYTYPRRPEVFDTGQVIFGWIALYNETHAAEYLDAAVRSADWLLSRQAGDGSWPAEDHAGSARAYHARVAWALAELGRTCGEQHYRAAARRHIEWVLRNQNSHAWFAHAELPQHPWPVTHTIAYTIRGVLECGLILRENPFVCAAKAAADQLITAQLPDGSLEGAYHPDWRPAVSSRCLTGCAQMSVNWLRLFQTTQDRRYRLAARRSNEFLMATQNLRGPVSVRGAIKGSLPYYGTYQRFSYPNWAAKFFADALMMELQLPLQD